MALLAPIAFAVGGSLLTGGATWGMAAGWLIGSWLFGPKAENDNKIFDPGEEEIPSFNQALRGSTLPILFGTNRISSQIVWTKNWTVIRKESGSGGGGKSGGSGMGGKQGSQQGEVTYEYKWDLMFHVGMSDQNMDLLGGWLISERINDETIGAILAGADSQWATFNGLIQAASEVDSVWDSVAIGAQYESGEIGADFDFEDSYYHGAGATGVTFDNWTHFQTEEGGPYRWPYTCYIGFKQFNLGSSARVPQITWEVGEGGVSLQANGASTPVQNLSDSGAKVSSTGNFMKAIDGSQWFVRGTVAYNLADGTTTDFSTIYGAGRETLYGETPSSYNIGGYDQVVLNGRYFVMCRSTLFPGTSTLCAEAIFFQILNAAGDIEVTGGWGLDAGGGITTYDMWTEWVCVGIAGEGTDDDKIIGIGSKKDQGFDSRPVVSSFPSINEGVKAFKLDDYATVGNYWTGQGYDRANTIYSEITGADSKFFEESGFNYTTTPAFSNYSSRHFLALPIATIGLLGVTWDTKLYVNINWRLMEWHRDEPASVYISTFIRDTLEPAYPNGCWLRLDAFEIDPLTGDMTSDGSGNYTVFDDPISFAGDDGVLEDGVTTNDGCYWGGDPTWQRLSTGFGAGGVLLLFAKNFAGAGVDQAVYGAAIGKVAVVIWNPLAQTWTKYATLIGSVADSYADWNQSGSGFTELHGDFWFFANASEVYAKYGDTGDQTNASDSHHIGQFGSLTISGGTDIPPPEIIYRILTSSVYGLGISADDIDTSSYTAAVLYCQNEGILVSAQYRREESALAIITQLLELYGGFLIDSGGKIKFGLQEFSSSVVRTIDNDHLRIDQEGEPPVLITKGARQDTYNRVKVNYFDRSLDYRQNFIEVSDEVDMDVNGVRAQEFPAKFVMSEATARKMAVRALWGNMYARDIYDFKLGAKDADLEPGDVITLVDSYHSELQSGKQARIVTWQETEPLTFQVKAVEEVEYISTSTLAADDVTEATKNVLNIRPKPMAEFGMYELPDEYQGADAQLFVGYRQQSPIMGARLYVSADGVTYGLAGDTQPYVISGIFLDGLPSRNPGYVEENVEVYLIPDTTVSGGFNTTTPYFAQKHTLDDVNASGRASGLGNIWAGSEMLAFEGVNLVAQNWYRFDKLYRGWGGTHIQDHSSGATWWKQAAGIFTQGINQDKIGTLIYYKVTGYNFNGVEYNLSSVDARTYQILGTYWRPQVQAPIATYVQSPASYLTIQSEDLGVIQKKQVVSGGSPVQFEWSQSAREAGYGAAGYGIGGYGRFTQDTTSVNYMVQVLSSDLSTVVRCTTVDTTAFLYSTALNSEDWNGWQGSFAVRVTPFNPVGTALRSRTKILELFE